MPANTDPANTNEEATFERHAPNGKRQQYIPGLMIVRVDAAVTQGLEVVRNASTSSLKALRLPDRLHAPFEALKDSKQLKRITPVFARKQAPTTSAAVAFAASVQESENEDLVGINLVEVSKSADPDSIVKLLEAIPGVLYAEPVPARWCAAPAVVHDPLQNRQWGLAAINWLSMDDIPDASGVKVAIFDTGIDTDHPDLQVFRSYIHNPMLPTDKAGHGSHVAGIVAALANNDIGISGICAPDLEVYKIFDDADIKGDYYVNELMYQRALNDARNGNVKVINLSIGGTAFSRTESDLIKRLISSGCVVVAAMGNEFKEGNPISYPAAYEGVLAVGAIDQANRRAEFSNTGKHISLMAPGVGILSTVPRETGKPDSGYEMMSGTSMATPHVTAAVALLRAKDPNLSPSEVKTKLEETATKLPGMRKKARTVAYGAGLLNLRAALI